MIKIVIAVSSGLLMLFITSSCYANQKVDACKKEKNCDFMVFGTASSDPKMSFIVLERTFKKFSDKDKNDLREILKRKIQDANSNPHKYVDIPASAPAYNMFINNVRNMRSYSIILSEKKGRKGLYIDKETMINY